MLNNCKQLPSSIRVFCYEIVFVQLFKKTLNQGLIGLEK